MSSKPPHVDHPQQLPKREHGRLLHSFEPLMSVVRLSPTDLKANAIGSAPSDGVNEKPRQTIESLRKVKALARGQDVVVLPAHGPRAARRLADNEAFRPTPPRA